MKDLITIYDNGSFIDRYTIGLNLPSGDSYLSLLFREAREVGFPLGYIVPLNSLDYSTQVDIIDFIKKISE
mgnify:CR=1 FL=1